MNARNARENVGGATGRAAWIEKASLTQCIAIILTGLAFGQANTADATPTFILTSGLTLDRTAPANLISNGSFESGGPGTYWATGTTGTPYSPLPGWVSSGGPNAYAQWDNTALFQQSAPLPDGTHGLYFGNGSPASASPTPTFNSDGTVTFTSSPVVAPGTPYRPPVTLSQTVSLNTTQLYELSFWTSGEGVLPRPGYDHDGIFGLDITGFPTIYLAIPSGVSGGLGTSHVYEFLLQPTVAMTTITFTNWGHFFNPTLGFTTEFVMDDVILNATPEPATLALFGIGLAGLTVMRRRKLHLRSNASFSHSPHCAHGPLDTLLSAC